jgi:hypothetical protein
MTHLDTSGKHFELPPEISHAKLGACTCTVLIPSAGTFNVEWFPFASLAHVVQFVRGAAWTSIGPIECMLPIGSQGHKIPLCTVTGILKSTMIYFIFDTLVKMILHIPFSKVNTQYSLTPINVQSQR